MMKTKLIFSVIISVLGAGAAQAFDAPAVFEKKCSSCHSIGQGDSIGPDLKDVTKRRSLDWILKFVATPEAVILGGDKDALAMFEKFGKKFMPDQDFKDSEIKAILKYIEGGGGGGAKIKSALDAKPGDIAAGESLFTGQTKLMGGGVACMSCHTAGSAGVLGGGTVALDLTNAYSKYKDTGISQALKNIAFPVMATIYEEKPLTDDEIFKLKAFLYAKDLAGPVPSGAQKKFLFLGLGGAAFGMGVMDFAWRRRRKHAVKNFRGGRS
jgi:cytochrome c2